VENFPDEHRYALASQITRSAVSIPSNIVEGSSRCNEKDYNRFLEISLGSSFELETQLLIAQAVGFSDAGASMLEYLDGEQKMLMSFMSRLKR